MRLHHYFLPRRVIRYDPLHCSGEQNTCLKANNSGVRTANPTPAKHRAVLRICLFVEPGWFFFPRSNYIVTKSVGLLFNSHTIYAQVFTIPTTTRNKDTHHMQLKPMTLC